ncbi:hypothetical protein D9615_003030 [Tricholomella constricta]|uniref:Uncharacterized protein n=1 Tax=Tricholomella constricta TaxID=117010 RepID=A0A8H5M6K9_9AGAR|nr:hypothetical protein D9615_003030 [Tricholomella constricta]
MSSILPSRPRRKTANRNPAQIVLDAQTKRRTSKQVQEDKARVEAEAAAAASTTAAKNQAKIQGTAALEDRLEQEQMLAKKHAAHPDLFPKKRGVDIPKKAKPAASTAATATENSRAPSAPNLKSTAESKVQPQRKIASAAKLTEASKTRPDITKSDDNDSELEYMDTEVEYYSEGLLLPAESMVDSESDGMLVDDTPTSDDEDFENEGVEDDDEEQEEVAPKKKPKECIKPPPTRDLAHVTSTKRKGHYHHDSKSVVNIEAKRAKKSEPTGLRSDWKKRIAQTAGMRTLTQTSKVTDDDNIKDSKNDDDDSDDDAGRTTGEFDQDEAPEQLSAVKNSKMSVKMRVKVQEVDVSKVTTTIANVATAINFKKKPVACLPFPSSSLNQEYMAKWQKEYRSTAINWAGTLSQPFSASALVHEHVPAWWDLVYPGLTMEAYWTWTERPGDALIAVIDQTSKLLQEWRSSIGKEGITILGEIYYDNGFDREEMAQWVKDMCGGPGKFCWLYANPEGEEGEKGAFQSELVLEIFSRHMKKTSGAMLDHGLQVGALALCTASVERAFELWANGEDPKKSEDAKKKAENVSVSGKRALSTPSFGGVEWIRRTGSYAMLASGLKRETHWAAILAEVDTRLGLQHATTNVGHPEEDIRATLSLCSLLRRFEHFVTLLELISMDIVLQYSSTLRLALCIPTSPINRSISTRNSNETSGLGWIDRLVPSILAAWSLADGYCPAPEKLVPDLKLLFEGWANVKCSIDPKHGALFSDAAKKQAAGIVRVAELGLLSDPPGFSLYRKIGTDPDGLTVYRCLRGTNSIEGELADAALANIRHRRNTTVGWFNRTGKRYRGHFDNWRTDEIVELAAELNINPSFPIPSILGTRIATKESSGIIRVPKSLTSSYGMHRVESVVQEGTPYHRDMPVHLLTHLSTARLSVYEYLRQRQQTAHAVVPIHTSAEYKLFNELLATDEFSVQSLRAPVANQTAKSINFEKFALRWNQVVHERPGVQLFYKIPQQLERHHKVWAAYRAEKATLSNSAQERKEITSILDDPGRRSRVLPALVLPEPGPQRPSSATKVSRESKGKARKKNEMSTSQPTTAAPATLRALPKPGIPASEEPLHVQVEAEMHEAPQSFPSSVGQQMS